jgi:hypothetical protein
MWINLTIEKESPVSHCIYICTINDKQTVELISAAILGLGVKTSPAASNGSLFHEKNGSKTTVMAIRVDNFSTKLSNTELLDRICKAIDRYTYFGIIIEDSVSRNSNWRSGNVGNQEFDKVMCAQEKTKPEPKPEPKPTNPTIDTPPQIDLKTVAKIVKATANMSDIFFDDIPQADRKLLARELERLCEDPNASLDPKG